jgi:hypothetical protein
VLLCVNLSYFWKKEVLSSFLRTLVRGNVLLFRAAAIEKNKIFLFLTKKFEGVIHVYVHIYTVTNSAGMVLTPFQIELEHHLVHWHLHCPYQRIL